jgi:AGZA family xanthine/uracil permease-like MFS transporter
LLETFQQNNLFVHGAFALEQGHILAAIALASMTVYIIEQKFHLAGIWALIAAGFSWFGLIHSYAWTTTDTIGNLQWGAGSSWAAGYGLLAILFFYTAWKSRSQTQSSTPPIGANLSSEPVD